MLLEAQLFEVIEREGAVTSSSIFDESRLSNRARRGIRRRTPKPQQPLVQTTLVKEIVSEPIVHPVGSLDQALVLHVQELANRQVSVVSKRSSNVPVRFSTHEPSDHVVSFQLPARPMVLVPRDPFGKTIRDWMAPYEVPPSVDGFIGETQDLWIEDIDPRTFIEQFTPGHAHIAYAQSYDLWSKLVAPFVKWEVVDSVERAEEPQESWDAQPTAEAIESQAPIGQQEVSHVTLHFAAPQEETFAAEQFTSPDPEEAYRASYGLWARIKRGFARLTTIFDRTAKEAEEEFVEVVEKVEEEAREVVQEIHEAEQEWGVPILVPRIHVLRVMTSFFGLLLIVTIPAGAVSLSRSFGSSVHEVKAQSQAALDEVQSALSGSTNEQALAWSSASERFGKARESLMRTNALALGLAQALPQTRSQYASAQALLSAGEKVSQAATLLTRGLGRALDEQASIRPDERLGIFTTYLDYAAPLLEDAFTSIDHVDPSSLPASAQQQFTELRGMIGDGRSSLTDARSLLAFLRDALGREAPRTYLFVFQNQTELRPTGGFMGSVAEVVFDRGQIQSVHVPGGGPYDLRDQLRSRVAPPRPLQLVGGRWEFQDANWFPDFPASANKMRWFWSQAGQPTVDGVVTVNASMLQALLRITGPIDMPEYGKVLTADNVMEELQKSVELEYDKKENKPKKIIGDLLPKVLEHLKTGKREEWLRLIDIGLQSLETKDIQVWMTRAEEEQLVERYDWNGRLKPTIGDALAIIEANIAGQKTDGAINEKVEHRVEVATDGSIVDTVSLTRTHTAPKGELFHGVNNVSYLRVYVPQGSELLDASGFEAPSSSLFETPLPEDGQDQDVASLVQAVSSTVTDVDVTNEFGRTAFGGWIQLRPQETRTTTFRYKLPFTVFDLASRAGEEPIPGDRSAQAKAAYMLLLTSQSGKSNRTIQSTVTFPPAWGLTWTNQATTTAPGLALDAAWDRDRVLAGLLEVKE